MEEKIILQIKLLGEELIVEAKGVKEFPPLMVIGLLEKVKLDYLSQTDTMPSHSNITDQGYDA